MISIKVNSNQEIRRIRHDTSLPKEVSFESFKASVREYFPQSFGKDLSFTWVDEENDTISLSTYEEFDDAIVSMASQEGKIPKFSLEILPSMENFQDEVPLNSPTPVLSDVVHPSVRCDECNVYPIVGFRYKCTVRENFDLCQNCEASKVQPFPMIKFYNPDQSKGCSINVLVETEKFPGVPPGFGPLPSRSFSGTPPPPVFPGYGRRHFRPGGPCGRGFGRNPESFPPHWQSRKLLCKYYKMRRYQPDYVIRKQMQDDGISPEMINAFFAEGPSASSERQTTPPEELNEIDQQIVDQAIRLSLEKSNESSNESSNSTRGPTVVIATPISSTTVEPTKVVNAVSEQPRLPKPSLRFVKDVTFPDGTTVQQGTVFNKVWRVRNDGPFPWPQDANLVCAGGDLLTPENIREHVPALASGEEYEITLSLTAPRSTGRFVSYFRLQTLDGVFFGQRLWVDIRVAEESTDWDMVSSLRDLSLSMSTSNTPTFTQESSLINEESTRLAAEAEQLALNLAAEQESARLAAEQLAAEQESSRLAAEAERIASERLAAEQESARLASEASRASLASVRVSSMAIDAQNQMVADVERFGQEFQQVVEMGFPRSPLLVQLFEKHSGLSGTQKVQTIISEILSNDAV